MYLPDDSGSLGQVSKNLQLDASVSSLASQGHWRSSPNNNYLTLYRAPTVSQNVVGDYIFYFTLEQHCRQEIFIIPFLFLRIAPEIVSDLLKSHK